MSGNNTERLAVSQHVTSSFKNLLLSISKREMVINMIAKNLTYDDPGMFIKTLVCDERDRLMQDATVIWLLNQVIWMSNEPQFYCLLETSRNLQENVLTASYLKQPPLYNKLLNKYIEFTNLLSNGPVQASKPLTVTMFEMDDFDMTTIDKDCSFKQIKIANIKSQNYILMTNVKLLGDMAIQMANSDVERTTQCTKCILNTFTNASIEIKSKCLRFFSRLLKTTLTLNETLQPMIVWILECIEEIETRIPTWIHHKLVKPDDIEEFIKYVNDLLNNQHIAKLFDANILRQTINTCLKILQTHHNFGIQYYEKIVPSIYTLIKAISYDVGDEFTHRNMYKFVKETLANDIDFRKNIELLGPVVLEQMKNGHMQSWCVADTKTHEILNQQNSTTETIINHLKCLAAILKTVRFMEYNLSIHLQREMCSKYILTKVAGHLMTDMRKVFKMHMETVSRRLLPQLDELSKYVIMNFSLLLKSKYSPLVDTTTLLLFTEIAIGILSVSDAQEIDDYLQSQLLLIALCPFIRCSELLFNHLQASFEEETRRLNKIMESPFVRNSEISSWQEHALQMIACINLKYILTKNKDIFMDILGQICSNLTQPECLDQIINVLVSCVIQVNTYGISDFEKFLKTIASNANNHLVISRRLSELYCISSGLAYIFQTNKGNTYPYKVICPKCDTHYQFNGDEAKVMLQFLDKNNGKFVSTLTTYYNINDKFHVNYFKLFKSNETQIRANMSLCLPSILNHLDLERYKEAIDYWLNPIIDDDIDIRSSMGRYMVIFPKCGNQFVVRKCLEQLLQCTKKFLMSDQYANQSSALQLISSFATSNEITEPMLLNCFRMILYFCMSSKSMLSRQAALRATEMCYKFGITPKNLLIWYKTDIFKLIVTLCVSNHISYNVGLQKSLQTIGQMFGYTDDKQDFIVEHSVIILALLVPWYIKQEKCIDLIVEISEIIQKNVASTLNDSFLSIYLHLHLYENDDVREKAMEFVLHNTDNTLYELLRFDIKQTVAEILVYYHKKPEFIMRTFRYLLSDAPELENCRPEFSTKILVDYLKERFLGVICHFEQILINDHEKSLKREILLSIGGIMRFMGSENITQFRFKLLAVLRTALDIKQVDLKDICAKVWKIFISMVNLDKLGPLLSTIIVSLEPLMEAHHEAVNEILRLLIIENGNVLSTHIADLFFLQHTNVSDEIKAHVAKYTEKSDVSFFADFMTSLRNINHDNLRIRIYGLDYLTELFESNRNALNNLIIGQQKMHSSIENLLDILMICIKSHDEALQIAAGRCLGQLSAIEPSHLSPNYRPQASFARSINTDEFAITALTELCSAYQSQKDTKNVDAYSLAIQEILVARNVCPQRNQNLKVWQAIPERMKSLVEPLLTSCYTITTSFTKLKIHPVFGSIRCTTYEEWAFTWASKTVDVITDDSIRSLLRSFKLSMRFDIRILTMALPYIILHAIQLSEPNDRLQIAEEFSTIANHVANKSEDNRNTSGKSYINYKTIRDLDFSVSTNSESIAKNDTIDVIAIKCAKLIFNQLDFLDRWVRTSQNDQYHKIVSDFVNQFDKRLLASANYRCGEYARALMYLETYIEENPGQRLQKELSFLFQIYAELMDPDSLEGALNLKDTEPTLTEQILRNNVQGRLQESTVCYERMMHVHGLIESNAKDMIECYLGLDQPETAILLAEGLMKELYDQNADVILQSTAEPLWRLSRFEALEELIDTSNFKESSEWGIRCGQILLDFRKNNNEIFESEINKSRLAVLTDLRIVGDEQNCYHKGYSNVMKLHLISEIEQAYSLTSKFLNDNYDATQMSNALKNLFHDWDGRLQLLQPAARIIEPVLCLRRIVLNEVKSLASGHNMNENIFKSLESQINDYIGTSWIKSIDLAREEGCIQQADLYILNAESYKPKFLFIEKAKLLWKKGDQTNCFKVLERGIEELKPNKVNRKSIDNLAHAEAKFLIAYYNAESLNISNNLNVHCFKQAIQSDSEKAHVHYAQYLDKTLAVMPEKTAHELYNPKAYDIQLEIFLLYFKSMLFGSKYVYQSMPRALSIWLDFTAASDFKNKKQEDHFKKCTTQMNQIAENYTLKLPPFVFFTAFSQLVSRICHPSNDVYNVLKTILVKLIQSFPQQSLWMILSVYKSSYASRVRRCTEVLTDKRLQSKEMQKLIQDFNAMAEKMIELTNKELPGKQLKFSVKQIYPQLPALLSKPGFSQILLPIQKYMQPVLPPLHQRDEPAMAFNAFPNRAVYIIGMKDELTVLPSLQRPRRVTLMGSDGKKYTIMMKPKDDLRKDFRLMEFNSVVKQYLHQNSDARQRRLNIRTYAVMPLNEECGILEWVPDLQAFRNIVSGYYKQKRIGVSSTEVKEGQRLTNAPLEQKRDWFKRTLVKCPPIFSNWFRERFTTPHNWYEARNSYVRTTAVMSIVGYILGLGDRHGENILFDSNSGDIVHVDFNCLFNKGEQFEVPEVVPFRLTHNMVHAMGPLGVEGSYRRCCEITLKVLQDQMPTLMSVLRPFVYDPLVSWSRQSKSDGRSERTDSGAMQNVQKIEQRLKGYVKTHGVNSNMPLSTEGVVNHCISEATDIDKLASMYIGWGAYL
ncbi:serine/threonine-protein kinase ATR [Contarinia nasturtii]|uniref:serine/threonine-protein kinase ATR n=1 Tax=Contarinia nasturtii TaxID=265458 RepID=UPI0012D4672C|nr:serine/threonine-protein kinase ATR [Contarinia nasturtii]